MKIATIIGARPQFIKAATVSRTIAEYNRNNTSTIVEEIIIHTGQHYDDDMSAIFFRELEIPEPKNNLGIGSGTHGHQTGAMLAAIEEVLRNEKPDWVLIYGDTNSTLAGALAAAKLHIPIAHVEAGLRSFNRRMPEEINRVIADQLSTLLFCPSQNAVDNLAAEGVGKNEGLRPIALKRKQGSVAPVFPQKAKFKDLTPKVLLVGDVMADALQFAATKAEARSDVLERLGLQLQGYLLATVHRAENTDDIRRLADILAAFATLNQPVVFPVHPRTRKFLQETGYQPSKNMMLIDPLGYFDFIALERSARMILTDSGGMQKEAYWLKVPCITLRDETEWTETVELGWNILAGADCARIISAVRNFKEPAEHPPLYGDGQASKEIVKILLKGNSLNHV